MKAPTKNITGIHPRPGYALVEVIRSEDDKPLIILPQAAQRTADEQPFQGKEDVYILEHNPVNSDEDSLLTGTRVLVEPEEQILIPGFNPRVLCIVAEKYIKAWID